MIIKAFQREIGGYEAGVDGPQAYPTSGELPTPNEAAASRQHINSGLVSLCVELFPVGTNVFLERTAKDKNGFPVVEFGWEVDTIVHYYESSAVIVKRDIEGQSVARQVEILSFFKTQLVNSDQRTVQDKDDAGYIQAPIMASSTNSKNNKPKKWRPFSKRD